jgi:diaminopimelate epimerase
MNGAGNDFVLIDNLRSSVELTPEQVRHICDRRRGVGADGLILLRPSGEHDFHMSFFNSDGHPAEMCGNGARCAAHFAVRLGRGKSGDDGSVVRFSTDSGVIEAVIRGGRGTLAMMNAREMRGGISVQVANQQQMIHFIVVGTRHAIVPVNDATTLTHEEIMSWGKAVRHDEAFAPVGANVNFVSVESRDRIQLRTYEKGVEAETLACGTGSIAAAVVLAHQERVKSPVTVVQSGGEEFVVRFSLRPDGADGVVLEGPAAVNFDGSMEI